MRFIPRATINHSLPPWVETGALFFITVAAAERGGDICTRDQRADNLLEAARHYHASRRWFCRLLLVMPDHVHALLAFPRESRMAAVVGDWKRYTSARSGFAWQRYFFDHRIRNDENWELKAHYIRQNPVRKGLVSRTEDWTWIFEA